MEVGLEPESPDFGSCQNIGWPFPELMLRDGIAELRFGLSPSPLVSAVDELHQSKPEPAIDHELTVSVGHHDIILLAQVAHDIFCG